MAKHKSATEVTVVTEEKSLLQEWVDQHWVKVAGLGVVIAGFVLFNQSQNQSANKAKGDRWNGLLAAEGDLDKTKSVTQGIEEPTLHGWGLSLLAQEAVSDDKPAEASSALADLAKDPNHILNSTAFGIETENGRVAPAAFAKNNLEAQVAWETAHPTALTNPDPAEGSSKVTMHTSEGDIEITLYNDLAPGHVENFLKLVDEKFYDGILFH
ncbi:MAG: peptidylprolyl isomerase, partial [Planctomycetes bacterium]|nr:peptidylprolyl isomerase [Planctomycetota bacterium]